MTTAGATHWTIPDAYMPQVGPGGDYVGHESVVCLNTGSVDAELAIHFFFADRPPVRNVQVVVPAERCIHFRFDQPDMLNGFEVPREVPYGLEVESSVPVVVQYSRLDVTQPNMAFLSAMGHSA